MHDFINSPALAKLVAIQIVDEEIQRSRRRPRTIRKPRLGVRRAAHRTATAPAPRRQPTAALAEDH